MNNYEHFQLSQKVVLYSQKSKKFLLLKDAAPDSEYVEKYGLWDLPGGRLEKGEDQRIALEREMKEEIGDLKYELGDVVYATTMSVPKDDPEDPHRVKLFSLATTDEDAVTLSEEHTEFAWKTLEEIETDADCKEWLKNAVAAALTSIKARENANDAMRILADFENYKRRQAAEAKEMTGHLAKRIVSDLIPVLNNLHSAASHVPEEAKSSPWVTGITYIEKQFEDVLGEYGVEPVNPAPGDTFDPALHEAIEHNATEKEGEAEGGEPVEPKELTIEKVIQKGYKIGERVLKAASVIVK